MVVVGFADVKYKYNASHFLSVWTVVQVASVSIPTHMVSKPRGSEFKILLAQFD
jgi:hypothetical protein